MPLRSLGRRIAATTFAASTSMQNKYTEVPIEKLKRKCDYSKFDFETTETLSPTIGIIGQERAVRAMEFGLTIKNKGYNIFMMGPIGTGKTTYAKSIVTQMAENEKVPNDWCYIYNFNEPDKPLALTLPAGKGPILSRDMDDLIEQVQATIIRVFNSEDYERAKNDIIGEFQSKSNELLEELEKEAEKDGFLLRRTNTGIVSIPIKDGKPLEQEEFDQLNEEEKKLIEANRQKTQTKMAESTRKLKILEREARTTVAKLDKEMVLETINPYVLELKNKYEDDHMICDYLDKIEEDIIENLEFFKDKDDSQIPFPWVAQFKHEFALNKYKVNVFVNNGDLKGAPVVIETNPTYYNLIGGVEYRSLFGELTTDVTMIKSGAIHRANGGYLILQAFDVLNAFMAWDVLKRILKHRKVQIENIGEQYRAIPTVSLKPEPIPVDLKVIMIGNSFIYHLLYNYDDDFKKLFKVKADFDTRMPKTSETMTEYAQFISYHCNKEGLKHFTKDGVAAIIEYASRLVEDQKKLTTNFNRVLDMIYEANVWAERDGTEYIDEEHVNKAIKEKLFRSNRIEERIQELIQDGKILIDTKGESIGQVNGLAIYDFGDFVFGKPTRITAKTYMGRNGIINIERESNLSGNIHDKGVLILSGYLGGKYGQDKPISLSASIGFEQAYEGVDGDSASSSELYTILSSLAELPINQGIAVTGSVNQHGEIQPVGGVTEKIEGFFAVSKVQGFTGKQGVIIPYQNIDNLMLSDEVIEAVKEGKFHIYPIKNVDEGIELLTGIPAGKERKNGSYPKGSVNYLVNEKLKRFAQEIVAFGKDKDTKKSRSTSASKEKKTRKFIKRR